MKDTQQDSTSRDSHYLAKILAHPADCLLSTQPLGALYTPEQTTFRVWAPTANEVHLHLYQAPAGGKVATVELVNHDDGTWDATLNGALPAL